MKEIPQNFYRYKQMPIWENDTIPKGILNIHNTKIGVYGKINVLQGALKYTIFKDINGEILDETIIENGDFGIAEPQQWHKVEPIGEVKMMVEFFQEKDKDIQKIEEDFKSKFPDKSPHYEVIYLASLIENSESKKALDLGSGGGRNSLLLANCGMEVTSWDKNLEGLFQTKSLAERNNLKLNISQKDLNKTIIEENFDIIISTIVLQFLEKDSAIELLKSAIEKTNVGGYNLIIVPVDSHDIKCPIEFPNLITYEEYLSFYKNWKIVYQDDMVGRFHRTDENGNRIASRFATIIAKKV